MERSDEDDYREYVVARIERLRRAAYALCQDWHAADDLVSATLGKLYRHWKRARDAEQIDAYVRTMLTRCWLDEQRRPWRRERVTDPLPEPTQVEGADPADRIMPEPAG